VAALKIRFALLVRHVKVDNTSQGDVMEFKIPSVQIALLAVQINNDQTAAQEIRIQFVQIAQFAVKINT
jgi:hypothetical protein